MAKKTILMPTLTAARHIDTLNASFVHTADLENGSVFQKGSISDVAGESQVYDVAVPATGAGLKHLWMAFSPEDIITVDGAGNEYKLGQRDPRAFTNVAGLVFSAFKPQVGDKIKISAAGISGVKGTNNYVVAANGATKLAFSASIISGLTFRIIETTYFSIPSGTPSQRETAYLLECVTIDGVTSSEPTA